MLTLHKYCYQNTNLFAQTCIYGQRTGIGYMNYNPQPLSNISVLKSNKSFCNVALSFDSSIHTLCCLE